MAIDDLVSSLPNPVQSKKEEVYPPMIIMNISTKVGIATIYQRYPLCNSIVVAATQMKIKMIGITSLASVLTEWCPCPCADCVAMIFPLYILWILFLLF